MHSSICGVMEGFVAKKSAIVKSVVLLIVIAAGVAATLLYLREKNKPRELVLGGTLEARTVNVGSLVGGRVTRVLADEGRHVAAGDLLLTLETETVDRQVAEQRAA